MTSEPQEPALPQEVIRERLLGLLGLARRAGALAVGASAVEAMVRGGKRPVVVLARDTSANQHRRWLTLRPVRGFVVDHLDRADLAQRLGRGDLTVVAVADQGFVRGLEQLGVVAEPRMDAATSERR